jgi:regulator of protease activity HflC (stomatin/prohibitin superfamily)
MGGVHPPQDVASAFQETVAALQEKETSIQWARQYAVRNMIETVGSMSKAQKLIAAINASEKKKETLKKSNSPAFLLHNASGYVAQILAEASSYRWERENLERGRAERFAKELKLYDAAPKTYMASYYMSILESGLGNAEKYMLVGNRDDLILRFDFKDLTRNSKIENDQEAYFVETE